MESCHPVGGIEACPGPSRVQSELERNHHLDNFVESLAFHFASLFLSNTEAPEYDLP